MDDVKAALRAITANSNMHAWARQHGFSYSYVWRVANTSAEPSPRMCEALGFRKATTYEKVRS